MNVFCSSLTPAILNCCHYVDSRLFLLLILCAFSFQKPRPTQFTVHAAHMCCLLFLCSTVFSLSLDEGYASIHGKHVRIASRACHPQNNMTFSSSWCGYTNTNCVSYTPKEQKQKEEHWIGICLSHSLKKVLLHTHTHSTDKRVISNECEDDCSFDSFSRHVVRLHALWLEFFLPFTCSHSVGTLRYDTMVFGQRPTRVKLLSSIKFLNWRKGLFKWLQAWRQAAIH